MRAPSPYLIGCVLISVFACGAAAMGGVAPHPRVYEALYLLGFAGFACLAWSLHHGGGAAPAAFVRGWLPLAVILRLIPIGAAPTDDAHRYVWEGRVQLAGYNPYVLAPDDAQLRPLRDASWTHINHPNWPAVYPPLAQLVFRGIAALHPHVQTAKVCFVACDIFAVFLLRALLRRRGEAETWGSLYALCPLTLSAFAVEGHLDSLMIAFTLGALLMAERKQWAWAGTLLGLAVSAKLVAVVLVPLLLVRRWKTGLLAVGVAALSTLPYLDAGWALFEGLQRFSGESAFFNLVGTLAGSALSTPVQRAIGGLLLMAIAGTCLLRATDMQRASYRLFSGLLLALPVLHYWYLTWVLALAAGQRRWSWLAGAAACVFYFEAEHARRTTGEWVMPTWAPWVFWVAVGGTALLNRLGDQRHRVGEDYGQRS
ncbi:MAG: DUF2029 domain-containing protein [Phycisphaerales bacterium]|nr:DUF2029 domain-containing protein [Phycisphaerales bacterium]